jgi:C-terminal processing protease CtpA/Prc
MRLYDRWVSFARTSMMKWLSGVALAIAVASGAWADSAQQALVNADLEMGRPGEHPAGWALRPLSESQDYKFQISDRNPHAGHHCLEISHPAATPWGPMGLVTQSVPADPYRGKRIRFEAAIRTEVEGVGRKFGALWARAVRPGGRPCSFVDMGDRPCRGREWMKRSVILDVSKDAEQIEVGFILNATGRAWFDSASLEVTGNAGVGNESARPLEGRGLENLVAFTRLLGYVRYFHPSDEAASADWDRFAIDGCAQVEPAQSADDLARRLTALFAPLAPTLQIRLTASPSPASGPAASDDKAVHRVAWRHFGVSCNASTGYYRSERVTDRQRQGAPAMPLSPEPLPNAGEDLFEADLGGGLSCRLPIVLFADTRGTLPRATARPLPSTKPADFPPTGDDRATRLAGVVLPWNVFQHFYPYFDCVQTDWHAALREALNSAAIDSDATAFFDTLRRLVAKVEDSHGFVRGGSGTVAIDGALPLAWDWVEGQLVVTDVEPSARPLGIKTGDVVKTIDGRPASERVQIAERLVCGATAPYRRYRAIQDLRNGPAGQTVTLELEPPGRPVYSSSLKRLPADDSPLRGPSLRERRLPRIAEIEPGILYVDLDRVSDAETPALLDRLAKATGIVFDLRGYPYASQGFDLLTRFSDRPLASDRFGVPVTRFPDRRLVITAENGWSLPPRPARFRAKTAFVTDARAVSAAETLLALVANGKLAPIVGGPTAGSNGGVNAYVLPGGYRVSWTGMKTLKLDGSRHHGVGVLPTVSASRTIKGLAAGRDEVLEKALALVRG